MKKYIFVFTLLFSLYGVNSYSEERGTCIEGNCTNGTGIFLFDDRAQYSGEFKNGKMEGTGVLSIPFNSKESNSEGVEQETIFTWPQGSKYTGQWKEGKRFGKGVFEWSDGAMYTGEWDNVRNGMGTFVWQDGVEYTGEWKNDRMHGKGVMTWPSGKRFEGFWENDIIVNKGSVTLDEEKKQVYENEENKIKECFDESGLGMLRVEKDVVNVRARPNTGGEKLAKVSKGEVIKVIDKKNGWLKISSRDCEAGWVAGWLFGGENLKSNNTCPGIEESRITQAKKLTVQRPVINLRDKPNIEGKVIKKAFSGQVIKVLKRQKSWLEVVDSSCSHGWVAAWLFEEYRKSEVKKIEKSPSTCPLFSEKSTGGNKIVLVKNTLINLRENPNLTATVKGTLKKGDELKILQVKKYWYEVVNKDCQRGWTASWLTTGAGKKKVKELEQTKAAIKKEVKSKSNKSDEGQIHRCLKTEEKKLGEIKTVRVNKPVINLRENPDTTSKVVKQLYINDELLILRSRENWYNVIDNSCKSGWVASWVVE
ncbi:MAG: SH3 domain-containing protein [Nitrospinae bacterium]|nr:SH3 domain-containing protein [Nitrospinota bacterium]